MFVLGLQGSPRLEGNTAVLLNAFLEEAKTRGAGTLRLDVARKKVLPCLECGTCEKEGYCPIDDDMQAIYPLLWQADLVVMATPIFFYGPTAQLKAVIDRSQALWSRRYIHHLSDPGRKWRTGFLLSLGATKGKNLFEGTILTAKYGLDAMGAAYAGALTFWKVEGPGDLERHPTALAEARRKAEALVVPGLKRRRILFVCTQNTCLSQMASAFARFHGGDRLEAESGGTAPAKAVDPIMVEVMKEKRLDMAYRDPRPLQSVVASWRPETVISIGGEGGRSFVADASWEVWPMVDPGGASAEVMRQARDDIEGRVLALLQ